jgi:hypothetical protein
VPGGELSDRSGLDGGDGVEVDLREPLEPWELGVVDAADAAAFGQSSTSAARTSAR